MSVQNIENDYLSFLESKNFQFDNVGKEIDKADINQMLFPFQRDLTRWALRKGRCAIFADTGLGKTFMQLEWARLLDCKTLIIAPLSVAAQTLREAKKLNIAIEFVRRQTDISGPIVVTNYEMIEHFAPDEFDAVVLDESSILKGLSGKTRRKLTDMFAATKYKLCCTATPAPNDIAEIANHAEFLGIMSRAQMLASFFVHDENEWRLKGHATKAFFRWLASWGMSIKKPSDLGYEDDGFILPELTVTPIFTEGEYCPPGQLFFTGLKGIADRIGARQSTIIARAAMVKQIVESDAGQWLIWCGLNDEASILNKLIQDAKEVKGSDDTNYKIATLESFQNESLRVLITKSKIAGFGMNFQNCHNMIFMGLNDSWEAYYQCIRRCYRFGQREPVRVYIILSEIEREVLQNVQSKEREAIKLSQGLIADVAEFEREEIGSTRMNEFTYSKRDVKGKYWLAMLGDSAERLKELDDNSIDLSIYSPPFESLFTYSNTERDLGNSKSSSIFFAHYAFILKELFRLTKPGRNSAVHTSDVPAMLVRDGYIGLKDFPGNVIRAHEAQGWIYHGRITIDKNPQAQAIRTHSKALLFNQLKKDSSWCRPALGDYILVFRKPGDNVVPITPTANKEIDNETWIHWASPVWKGISESDTLQYTTARDAEDERHICPLQLGTIERCIKLWSNPKETILSPFGGIGSEGYCAVQFGRRAIMIELKESYFNIMIKNLEAIESQIILI